MDLGILVSANFFGLFGSIWYKIETYVLYYLNYYIGGEGLFVFFYLILWRQELNVPMNRKKIQLTAGTVCERSKRFINHSNRSLSYFTSMAKYTTTPAKCNWSNSREEIQYTLKGFCNCSSRYSSMKILIKADQRRNRISQGQG